MMSHYSNGTTTGNMTVHGFLLALHVWIYGCFNIILCGPAGVGRCYVMGEGKGGGKGARTHKYQWTILSLGTPLFRVGEGLYLK